MRSLIPLPFLLLAAAPLWGAPVAALPAGVTVLSGPSVLQALELVGREKESGRIEMVDIEGRPDASAVRLTTDKTCPKAWDIQAYATVMRDVKAGDVMLAQFALRSVSGGAATAEGRTVFVFEMNAEPWSKSVETALAAPREWTVYSIPFVVKDSLEAGKSCVCFQMGYRPQAIELDDFRLVWYGPDADLKALPRTRTTYQGRPWDSPWRKQALSRIQKIRKGDLNIEVKDAAGKPLPGASVQVTMQKHAFMFGTAVQAKRLAGFDMDPQRYKREIPKQFNTIVLECDLMWPFWEEGLSGSSSWRKAWVDDAMDWAEKNGLTVNGHCLVWPSWKYLPPRLRAYETDCPKLQEECLRHIRDVVGTYKGRIAEWVVMNESIHEHDLMDVCGSSMTADWFRAAREADPKAKLFINEYGILSGGGADVGTQDAYEKTIADLLEQGAPLDGIGIQSHLGQTPTDPEKILEILDRFGKFEKSLRITEFDFDPQGDDELGYEYMKDYLIALFSHPGVGGILLWGFWDGAQWLKQGPLYGMDWKLKPTGRAWREMVDKEWWTRAAGRTNGAGLYSTRGFFGDYRVTVTFGKLSKTLTTTLTPEGRALSVVLK